MPKFVINTEIPRLRKVSDAEFQALSRKSVGVRRAMGPR
jgi:hypothetical protein